jgi:alpha,alpha-trehalase
MPFPKTIFCAACLILAMDTTMILPPSDAGDASAQNQKSGAAETSTPLDNVLRYISAGWESLTRSEDNCKTYADIKTGGEPVLYFPADFPVPPSLLEMQRRCRVRFGHLPRKIERIGPNNIDDKQPEGLLYLEHPYVVPGGQFNEMYGWDSYFIIRGLLRQHHLDLAKDMVENFFFESANYGGVLNANRTYYLTRSQPPFLSSMVLAVYDAQTQQGPPDLPWLEKAYGFVVRDYRQWTQAPHLAGDTGLSRYFDQGEGPVPEILGDPSHYYSGAAHYFLIHEGANSPHLVLFEDQNPPANVVGHVFSIPPCDSDTKAKESQHCTPYDRMALSAEFYKGDRSMRESGFDVSFRFGPYGAETHHYAPVCLNSLLYKTEKDLEKMAGILGKGEEAEAWKRKAQERKERIEKYLWNGSRGLFFDYDFIMGKQSSYEYATTFYPLWAGLASPDEARAVARNLPQFEQPGGLAMSRHETQAQWDFPYGWAPIHLLAVEGLRRYGFNKESDRIAYKFLFTVLKNFAHDGTIREKYDVARESSRTRIGAGYRQNVVGFGWTNAVFLELLNESSKDVAVQLKKYSGKGSRVDSGS